MSNRRKWRKRFVVQANYGFASDDWRDTPAYPQYKLMHNIPKIITTSNYFRIVERWERPAPAGEAGKQ